MTGEQLRRTRRRLKLTQKGLARLAKLHPNTVARMERGEVRITAPMEALFKLLAKAGGR